MALTTEPTDGSSLGILGNGAFLPKNEWFIQDSEIMVVWQAPERIFVVQEAREGAWDQSQGSRTALTQAPLC